MEPTTAEMIWWIVWGVIGVLFLISLPILKNIIEGNEGNRFYGRCDSNIDDMEDTY